MEPFGKINRLQSLTTNLSVFGVIVIIIDQLWSSWNWMFVFGLVLQFVWINFPELDLWPL